VWGSLGVNSELWSTFATTLMTYVRDNLTLTHDTSGYTMCSISSLIVENILYLWGYLYPQRHKTSSPAVLEILHLIKVSGYTVYSLFQHLDYCHGTLHDQVCCKTYFRKVWYHKMCNCFQSYAQLSLSTKLLTVRTQASFSTSSVFDKSCPWWCKYYY